MARHSGLSSAEAADRLAIRELFDAYAHCADRRDAAGEIALFTADTRFAVYMDGEGSEPTYVLEDHRGGASSHSACTRRGRRAPPQSYPVLR
jgi:hypothetical protein